MIDVVAAAILDEGEFLACRLNPSRGNKWEFPGGKVEPGEALDAALRRELLEELGVEVEVERRIATVEHPELGIRLHSFLASLKGPRPTASTDHDRLSWCAPQSLIELDWSTADIATVEIVAFSVNRQLPSKEPGGIASSPGPIGGTEQA